MKSRVLRGLPVPKQASDGPATSPRLPYMQHAHHALPPSAILKNPFRSNASFATFCKRVRPPACLTGSHQAKKRRMDVMNPKQFQARKKPSARLSIRDFSARNHRNPMHFPDVRIFFLMLLRAGLEPATSGAKIWERESDGSRDSNPGLHTFNRSS